MCSSDGDPKSVFTSAGLATGGSGSDFQEVGVKTVATVADGVVSGALLAVETVVY